MVHQSYQLTVEFKTIHSLKLKRQHQANQKKSALGGIKGDDDSKGEIPPETLSLEFKNQWERT